MRRKNEKHAALLIFVENIICLSLVVHYDDDYIQSYHFDDIRNKRLLLYYHVDMTS